MDDCPNCQALAERVKELEDACRAIVRHQETIAGGLAVGSVTRRIAQAALISSGRKTERPK